MFIYVFTLDPQQSHSKGTQGPVALVTMPLFKRHQRKMLKCTFCIFSAIRFGT